MCQCASFLNRMCHLLTLLLSPTSSITLAGSKSYGTVYTTIPPLMSAVTTSTNYSTSFVLQERQWVEQDACMFAYIYLQTVITTCMLLWMYMYIHFRKTLQRAVKTTGRNVVTVWGIYIHTSTCTWYTYIYTVMYIGIWFISQDKIFLYTFYAQWL